MSETKKLKATRVDGVIKTDNDPTVDEPRAVSTYVQGSPEMLISQAIDKGVTVETMERLLDMMTKVKAQKAREEFVKAMAKFQSECPVIKKNKKVMNKDGKTVRYTYAPLDSIIDQVKKPLADNELSYSFDEAKDKDFASAICKITHSMGHSETSTFKVPIGSEDYMSDVQKYGSRMTFAKRYAFCNALGILTGDEDDDGQPDELGQDKSAKGLQTLKNAISKANIKELEDYKKKMQESDKYTDLQKKEYFELVDKRIKEISTK